MKKQKISFSKNPDRSIGVIVEFCFSFDDQGNLVKNNQVAAQIIDDVLKVDEVDITKVTIGTFVKREV